PETSTRSLTSLLAIASSAKSALPVLAPLSVSPTGSFTIPRTANASGCCRHCELRFTFAPTQKSPRLLPLHPDRASGCCGTTPPNSDEAVPGRNSGRRSRSIRLTSTHDPKISARSFRPIPKVTGQFDTSLKPWLSSKFTRYALSDQRVAGSTSPVGTFHRPVSPMKVVVAGRVCTSSVAGDVGGGACVVGAGACANAGTASVALSTEAIANDLIVRCLRGGPEPPGLGAGRSSVRQSSRLCHSF